MPHALNSRPTGQWLVPSDGPRWWFDSGSLAMDFAYTGGMDDDPGDRFTAPEDLVAWLQERFPEVDGAVGERELVDARALRDAIARASRAAAGGHELSSDDVDLINLYAATPDIAPALAGGTRQAGRTRARVGQALSELAREAVELFGPTGRERVRVCAADDCSIVFYDESRSNNRRWCSMERCGNRAKVRAHRAKHSLA